MRRAGGLTTLQHILRPNKLFDSFIMKLLHASQVVRITCASARRKNCGGGGFSKFRLAWRRAEFFSAARQRAGWRRRRLSGLAHNKKLSATDASVNLLTR